MNKSGQTLVVFIIIIPFLLLVAAFAIDSSLIINENVKVKNITKTIIKETLTHNYSEEKVKRLFKENEIETTELEINIQQDEIKIKNHYYISSIFAKVIGIKKYEIKIAIKGYKEADKIKFTKE